MKGTTLKTPFHIALFLMRLRSLCTSFLGRIPAMQEIRADLFLAISKIGMLNSSFFKRFASLVPSWPRFKKS